MNEAASKPKKGIGLADILISVIVLAIIGLIIIPLPSALLDILIIINLTIAINILLITLFTKSVLEFTTFPTLLLITTMFRLGLNLSSTRLILTQGNGGHVIDAFANVVAGSNYIVGIILFVIIMVVQLVVVTRCRACLRGDCSLHIGCDARQANGDRFRPKCRIDHGSGCPQTTKRSAARS